MSSSENAVKWAMRLYPPLFFQRIWVSGFKAGFRGVSVSISKSFLNTNHDHSIFGGTIYAAADPFHPILFTHLLTLKGYNVKAWSRSSAIRYFKPAKTDLHFNIDITDAELEACETQLKLNGKYRKSYQVVLLDKDENLCALVINEMYIRDLTKPNKA